jgi:hypothetical protein
LNPKFIRAYEHAWKLQIEEYFRDRITLKTVFVKYDFKAEQPWAMLVFYDVADAQDAINECETTRGHACFKGSGSKVWELLLKCTLSKFILQMVLPNQLMEPKNSNWRMLSLSLMNKSTAVKISSEVEIISSSSTK